MTNKVQHEIGIQALLNKKTAEIINMIDTKQFDPKSLFGKVKLKKSVSANLKLMPLKWVKDNYKLFFVDSETLQRFLQEWKKSKIDSYLSTVFGGLAHKDLFQLADIKKIVNAYKDRLEDETLNKDEKIALEDSYNYFKSLEDKKFTFLDWRQDFAGDLSVGDIYYDLAKLMHGLIVNHGIVVNNQYNVSWKEGEIKFDIQRKKSLVECEQRLNTWMLENGYNLKKVKVLTALIYLNIAALHHYPYSLLLYGLGKKMLKEELNNYAKN